MSTDPSAFVPTLRTLDGEITLEAALEEEQDILRRLTYKNNISSILVYYLVIEAYL